MKSLAMVLSVLIIGLGIGWLMALAVTPVVSIVITSVIGSASAILASLGSIKQTDDSKETPSIQINPVPLAILIIGVVAGSVAGLYVRTSSIYEGEISNPYLPQAYLTRSLYQDIGIDSDQNSPPSLTQQVLFWHSLGVDKQVVAQRFFDTLFPGVKDPGGEANLIQTQSEVGADDWVLYVATPADCVSWKDRNMTPEKLAQRLRLKNDSRLRFVADGMQHQINQGVDPEEVKMEAIEILCNHR